MLSASLYIIVCSARNRLRMRLRRLREPRYLIGAIVGALYLYYSVFARMRSRGAVGRRRGAPVSVPAMAALGAGAPAAVALALLTLSAISWILPFDSGLPRFLAGRSAVSLSRAGITPQPAAAPHAALADRKSCSDP